MSPKDEPTDPPVVRGAQTVAPVEASALQFAASILGEGGYTPDAQLGATLSVPARVHETDPPGSPATGNAVTEQASTQPVPTRAPVAEERSPGGVVPPVPVEEPTDDTTPTQKKGWFGRLLEALFGRR
ncbi:MAG: hypothetical protein ACRYF3_16885 [Janthinobacterium lividum]